MPPFNQTDYNFLRAETLQASKDDTMESEESKQGDHEHTRDK